MVVIFKHPEVEKVSWNTEGTKHLDILRYKRYHGVQKVTFRHPDVEKASWRTEST